MAFNSRTLLLSIPHTGTMWLMARLGEATPKMHTTNPNWREKVREAERVVVPMRHPTLVAISALNRGDEVHIRHFNHLWDYRDEPKFEWIEPSGEVVGGWPDTLGLKAAFQQTGRFPAQFTAWLRPATWAWLGERFGFRPPVEA